MESSGIGESGRRLFDLTRCRLSGLRFRLLLLVLLAVLPPLGMVLYTAMTWLYHETEDAQADSRRLARHVAGIQERRIIEMRDLLAGVARLPSVRRNNATGCGEALAGITIQFQHFLYLQVIKRNGEVLCTTASDEQAERLDHSTSFQRAIQTREFSVGRYQFDHGSGEVIADFSYPVLDSEGRVEAVAAACLDMGWLPYLVAQTELPVGTSVSLIDEQGTVLASYPNPQDQHGRSVAKESIFRLIRLSPWGGAADDIGLDGTRQLIGFQPLLDRSLGGNVFAVVSIPAAGALAQAKDILARNLVGLGVAAVLALAAAWVAGRGLFLRPVNALMSATKRLSEGDLAARTQLTPGTGELGILAGAFNEMAAALEARTKEASRQHQVLIDLERRFRALIENSSDGIVVMNSERKVTYVSPAITRILGYTVEEFLGRDPLALVRAGDRDSARAQFLDVVEHPGRTATVLVPVRHKDGSERWIEAVLSNVLSDRGVQGIVANYRDVSDRKRAEEALLEANEALEIKVERRTAELVNANQALKAGIAERERSQHALRMLSSAIEQTTDSVFITDRDGVIEFANAAFERLTGYRREEALGKTRRLLSSGEHRRDFYEHLWETLMSGEAFRGVFLNRKRNGELYYEEETITPLRDRHGTVTHFACAGRDITQRKRTEEALRRLNDRLEKESERIAHVFHDEAGQFLTSAHITLSALTRELPPWAQKRLQEVRRDLDEVEQRLRDLSHEYRPRILDDLGLRAALEFLAEGVAKRTGVRVLVKSALDGPLPVVVETTLYRFAQEALTNAAKYARASEVSVSLERLASDVRGSIRDDGVGFEVPEGLARAGDPGLGLRGIRDRVEALGGTLTISSAAGSGTELVAVIPLERDNATTDSAS